MSYMLNNDFVDFEINNSNYYWRYEDNCDKTEDDVIFGQNISQNTRVSLLIVPENWKKSNDSSNHPANSNFFHNIFVWFEFWLWEILGLKIRRWKTSFN